MILNVFKYHKHHLPHLHTSTFLRRAQKHLQTPKPPRRKSIRCALMPLRPMRHKCRFRCVIVRLVFNISPSSWQNKTVQGSSSISQTTPTTTSTHPAPKSTTPRPRHHRSSHCPPNWCQRPICCSSRLWLRPDHREKHSEQSNFDACWKSGNFHALISECLESKEGVSIQPFCWCSNYICQIKTNAKCLKITWCQNRPRIDLKHWYYQRGQNGTLSLWGLKYLPPQLRYDTHLKSSAARIPVTLLLIFKAVMFLDYECDPESRRLCSTAEEQVLWIKKSRKNLR